MLNILRPLIKIVSGKLITQIIVCQLFPDPQFTVMNVDSIC